MKISAIETGRISAKLDSRVRAKKDLTSFGVNNNQTQPNSDIDSKKANEAIKTTFLSNVSFGGHTEYMGSVCPGTSGFYYYIDDKNSSYYERSDAIRNSKYCYPYSKVSSKVDRFAPKKGGYTVYFADPEEVVSDDIKTKHDYIVNDCEPKFPLLDQIREKYFNNYNEEDLHGRCRTIYDYHERLKKCDLKELLNLMKIKDQQERELAYAEEYKQNLENSSIEAPWSTNKEDLNTADYYCSLNRSRLYFTNEKIDYYKNRIENSKTQQRLATTLYSILDEAGQLFMERDSLSRILINTKYTDYGRICSKEDAIKVVNKARAALSLLESKYSTLQTWQTLKHREFEQEEENNDTWDWKAIEKEKALKELDNLTRKLKNIAMEINELKPVVKKLEELPAQYDNTSANFQEVLGKLAKLYPKVEAFYKENAKRMLCG